MRHIHSTTALLSSLILCLGACAADAPQTADLAAIEKALADPAAAQLARPTPEQIAWADMEREMFVHFGVATWKGTEYDGNGQMDLAKMNPAKFDAQQLCDAAKSWGAKQIIVVCKHVGGFCWWQTQTTDYSVKSIPWKGGQGDYVKEMAAACRKNGLKMGIYIYSDDTRYAKGIGRGGRTDDPKKQEEWNGKLRQQWDEVLSLCGDVVHEVWFDGGCIVPLKDILDRHAPKALIFGGPHGTLRWPGTESGKLPYPCWSTIGAKVNADGQNTGDPDGPRWCPPECDTTLYGHGGHTWFWSARKESLRHSVDELMDIYLKSVGRGGVLLLNSNPNTDGAIPEGDMKVYREFGDEIQRRFGHPLAQARGIGDTVELSLGGLKKVNEAWIMEDLRGGQRIRAYVLEGRDAGGKWQPLAAGTSVGHKKIEVFPEIAVDALRLRVTQKVGTPIIRDLAAFYADGVKPETAMEAALDAPAAPCGKWGKGAASATFDLTPHIPMPATYKVVLRLAGQEKIRSAKLLFNGFELPPEDCRVVANRNIIVRQTQQVTAETRTQLVVEFESASAGGVANIRMISPK